MNRRNFISYLIVGAVTFNLTPIYADEPNLPIDPWKATSVEEVINSLYGDRKIIQKSKRVIIKNPKEGASGAYFPLTIKSDLEAKKVIVMQNANEFALVTIFNVPTNAIIEYSLKIKLRSRREGVLTVLIEDINGNLYLKNSAFETLSGGGCEG